VVRGRAIDWPTPADNNPFRDLSDAGVFIAARLRPSGSGAAAFARFPPN